MKTSIALLVRHVQDIFVSKLVNLDDYKAVENDACFDYEKEILMETFVSTTWFFNGDCGVSMGYVFIKRYQIQR